MSLTSILTSKGQVTVPATSSIRQLKGIVPKPATPVSIDDMNAAIALAGMKQVDSQ